MIRHSEFSLPGNPAEEHFFAGCAVRGAGFEQDASALLADYAAAAAAHGCSEESEILLRIHLSDVTNQMPLLERLLKGRSTFLSVVGQSPANGGRIALEAWHWKGCEKRMEGVGREVLRFNGSEAFLFRTEGFVFPDSFQQTRFEFESLKEALVPHRMTVADHTIRTWLYCRDVDNNYAGLVRARNEFFAQNGLSAETHFIASTGIEGQNAVPARLVAMDSISWAGLRKEQRIELKAEHMLSPTALYGVSFERGTRLCLRDRSHYYISGTASIDRLGEVVHPHDVRRQTVRMIENIAALLESSEGALADLRWATVYLRDAADVEIVSSVLAEFLPENLPRVVVHAPVCRPAWLVEMEGLAINANALN